MAATKNVIYDMGGVLINIDYQRTIKAFEQLGYSSFADMYDQYHADALFTLLETGKVSVDEFYDSMKKKGPEAVTREEITTAWNAMLLDFRVKSIEFLKEIGKSKNIYLLSNTNEIHLADVRKIYAENISRQPMDDLFLKSWYSNEIGYRKPNEDIFEFVLRDAGLQPEETLFVDDSYNNIETAVKMGFKTHLLQDGQQIEDLVYE